MEQGSNEKIEEFAYNSTTERLKELVGTMSDLLSMDNIEQLKDLGFKYKDSHRLHDILEKASKELEIYTKELERRRNRWKQLRNSKIASFTAKQQKAM